MAIDEDALDSTKPVRRADRPSIVEPSRVISVPGMIPATTNRTNILKASIESNIIKNDSARHVDVINFFIKPLVIRQNIPQSYTKKQA